MSLEGATNHQKTPEENPSPGEVLGHSHISLNVYKLSNSVVWVLTQTDQDCYDDSNHGHRHCNNQVSLLDPRVVTSFLPTIYSCFILDISFHSDVKCQGYEQQQKTLQEARLTPSAQTPMIQEPLAVCAAEGKFS